MVGVYGELAERCGGIEGEAEMLLRGMMSRVYLECIYSSARDYKLHFGRR